VGKLLEMINAITKCPYKGVDERELITYHPLVSVITPVLNGKKYIEACIKSVLDQSYPNIEHIFIDGGSTDGTVDLLTNYSVIHPDRIRFISKPRKGAEGAWNEGWKIAKGDIIGWLGSDDVYVSGAISTVVKFFVLNPEAYFVFGACETLNERNELISKSVAKDFDLDEAINDTCYIPTTAAFYRREVIDRVGFLDESLRCCDLEYWIRVGKVFKIYRIETLLSRSMLHKGSTSGSKGKKIFPRECFIISRRHGGRILSGHGIKYAASIIIESLRPVLGGIYPFFSHFMKRAVYPFIIRIVNFIAR
jgi:glycosyltransferase involved in cell wall biosynthesis